MPNKSGKYDSAEARWAGVGPYYAMFPARFADKVIAKFSNKGDTVIDPFAGRGTSIFSAATNERHALGVEINPVGWIYATTKLEPTQLWRAKEKVEQLGKLASRFRRSCEAMPEFFRACFSDDILMFLLAARKHLNWRRSVVDRTVMAILLVDLHGKRDTAFSNQMRQTKSMSPDYAIRWWKEHELTPPDRNPVELALRKLDWRYARGLPNTVESRVYLADTTHRSPALHSVAKRFAPRGVKLLFTSPPYFGVTNYHYDQWLRLWLLGGPSHPRTTGHRYAGRFQNPENYRCLLQTTFTNCRELLSKRAVIYVRTDRRTHTLNITEDVLKAVFPKHELKRRMRPVSGQTQTHLFGSDEPSVGEVDLILTPSSRMK